jgi:hypothetical protein
LCSKELLLQLIQVWYSIGSTYIFNITIAENARATPGTSERIDLAIILM